jgi:hypothetical protein
VLVFDDTMGKYATRPEYVVVVQFGLLTYFVKVTLSALWSSNMRAVTPDGTVIEYVHPVLSEVDVP